MACSSCPLTFWVSGIGLRLDLLVLVLRLGLTTSLAGSITITSPLLLVMVIGDGVCLVFILRFFSTPLGATIIEPISSPIVSGERVDKRGVNPAYPSHLTNPTYKVELARGVLLIYRVINEYLLGSRVLSAKVRQLTEGQIARTPKGSNSLGEGLRPSRCC